MKTLFYGFFLLMLLSACNPTNPKSQADTEALLQLDSLVKSSTQEKFNRQLIENYLSDLNSPDWENILFEKYWRGSSNEDNYESFVSDHKKFRKAYTNYNNKIKYIVTNDNEGIVWLRVSAVHTSKYDADITRETEETGKPVAWDEIWYYQVVDGKLGGNFELISDELSKLRHLGIKCLPDERNK